MLKFARKIITVQELPSQTLCFPPRPPSLSYSRLHWAFSNKRKQHTFNEALQAESRREKEYEVGGEFRTCVLSILISHPHFFPYEFSFWIWAPQK
jgi:hypothetical protein